MPDCPTVCVRTCILHPECLRWRRTSTSACDSSATGSLKTSPAQARAKQFAKVRYLSFLFLFLSFSLSISFLRPLSPSFLSRPLSSPLTYRVRSPSYSHFYQFLPCLSVSLPPHSSVDLSPLTLLSLSRHAPRLLGSPSTEQSDHREPDPHNICPSRNNAHVSIKPNGKYKLGLRCEIKVRNAKIVGYECIRIKDLVSPWKMRRE